MLIFLAVLFTILHVVQLVRGSLYKGSILKIKAIAENYKQNYDSISERTYQKEILKATIPMLFWGLLIMILQLIFYVVVVGINALTIPTICMMVLYIYSTISSSLKNKQINTPNISDTYIAKKMADYEAIQNILDVKTRTIPRTLYSIIAITYFSLALLVLISI